MAKSKPCKYCEQSITWGQVSDRWIPYNIDGTTHKCGAGVRDERPKKDTYTHIAPTYIEKELPKAKPQVTTMPTPTMGDMVLSKLDTIIMLLTAIKENL